MWLERTLAPCEFFVNQNRNQYYFNISSSVHSFPVTTKYTYLFFIKFFPSNRYILRFHSNVAGILRRQKKYTQYCLFVMEIPHQHSTFSAVIPLPAARCQGRAFRLHFFRCHGGGCRLPQGRMGAGAGHTGRAAHPRHSFREHSFMKQLFSAALLLPLPTTTFLFKLP